MKEFNSFGLTTIIVHVITLKFEQSTELILIESLNSLTDLIIIDS